MAELRSVCVYCGSSNTVDEAYFQLSRELGAEIAGRGIRMVYGGGQVGLMGASAHAAHEAGGEVLGVIPRFLTEREGVYTAIEHRVVETMHERKQMMFDESDAFIVLPGGIGTLEEVIETLSWIRLGLHRKPVAFLSENDYWAPLLTLLDHQVEENFTPPEFREIILHAGNAKEALDMVIQSARDFGLLAGNIPV